MILNYKSDVSILKKILLSFIIILIGDFILKNHLNEFTQLRFIYVVCGSERKKNKYFVDFTLIIFYN